MIALAVVAASPPDGRSAMQGRVYDRACDLVARHYWRKAALGVEWARQCETRRAEAIAALDARRFYARLNDLLDTLRDSHVFAVDPVRTRLDSARDAGRAAPGFGFAMAPDADGDWVVTQVRPASPAAQAGVSAGWRVREVDGRPVDIDFVPRSAVPVRFGFDRPEGRAVDLTLVPQAETPLPSRRARRLDDGLLLVTLDGFDAGDDRWLRRTLETEQPTALILDLRQNDGGDADVIARIAGLFFAENRPLVDRIAARHSVQRTIGAGRNSFRGPLALLIGPESASGAEALAALVAESGRGLTMGSRTAGALTGASLYRLPDGGQLSVAEFDIRTPMGERLEGRGLEPQIAVETTATDRRLGIDPVVARAKQALRRPAAD